MNEGQPGHDRRRRLLPWLLLLVFGLLMAELGAGIGWFAIHASAGKPHATASGVGYGVDGRTDSSSGSGSGSAAGTGHVTVRGAGSWSDRSTRSTTVRSSVVPATTSSNLRDLTVSPFVDGPLAPGVPRPLVITIHNAGTDDVRVTSVQVTAGQPSAPACSASWYAVTGQVPASMVIAAQSTGRLTWQMLLRDLPHHNQDACKGSRVPFRVRVEAVAAPR